MMVKEDYLTGSTRSRIIRWLRVQDPPHTHRDDEKIDQLVAQIGVMKGAGIA
jgi:hypothetical protein